MEQRKGSVERISILNRVSRVGFIKEDVSKFLKSKIVKADSTGIMQLRGNCKIEKYLLCLKKHGHLIYGWMMTRRTTCG